MSDARIHVVGPADNAYRRNGVPIRKWVYEVVSDMPLTVFSGMGNTVIVSPAQTSVLIDRDKVISAESGPQSQHQGRITLELKERIT